MAEKIKIYTYPDSALRVMADPVENIDEDIQQLINSMAETMYAAPGVGLAATQVGESKRILIYDISPKDEGRNLSVLINPEIILAEGEIIYDEACLSVIDFSTEIARNTKVKVRGVDRDGNTVEVEAEDLLARCLQHEIDHLNGILIIDHISSLKRSLYRKKLMKISKKAKASD
jgi:peptide deformylase